MPRVHPEDFLTRFSLPQVPDATGGLKDTLLRYLEDGRSQQMFSKLCVDRIAIIMSVSACTDGLANRFSTEKVSSLPLTPMSWLESDKLAEVIFKLVALILRTSREWRTLYASGTARSPLIETVHRALLNLLASEQLLVLTEAALQSEVSKKQMNPFIDSAALDRQALTSMRGLAQQLQLHGVIHHLPSEICSMLLRALAERQGEEQHIRDVVGAASILRSLPCMKNVSDLDRQLVEWLLTQGKQEPRLDGWEPQAAELNNDSLLHPGQPQL
jgi:hypothetical protein